MRRGIRKSAEPGHAVRQRGGFGRSWLGKTQKNWIVGQNDGPSWLQSFAHGGEWPGVGYGLNLMNKFFGGGVDPQWTYDPRKKSKNLGHIVDGFTGWCADLGMKMPIVWPITGYGCRLAAGVIRVAEDIVNGLTGLGGIQLFIILTCLLVVPVGAIDRKCCEGKECFMSNVCKQKDIRYCSHEVCWHAVGCVVATSDGCWDLAGNGVSVRPGSVAHAPWLAHHLDAASVAIYCCELFGLGEYCGMAVMFYDLMDDIAHEPIELNCSLTCGLEAQSSSQLLEFFTLLGKEVGVLGVVKDILMGMPVIMQQMLHAAHVGVLLVMLAYLIDGRWVRGLVLLALYSGLVNGDCYNETVQGPCLKVTNSSVGYMCWRPDPYPPWRTYNHTHHIWDFKDERALCSYVMTTGRTTNFNFYVSQWGLSTGRVVARLNYVTWGCCSTNRTALKCTTWRGWGNFSKCYWGPNITEHISVVTEWPPWNYAPRRVVKWGAFSHAGRRVEVSCKPTNSSRFRRMPGGPVLGVNTGRYLANCPGYLWDIGTIADGLMAVDRERRQLLTGVAVRGLSVVAEHFVLMFCLMQFMGARVCSLVYLAALVYQADALMPLKTVAVVECCRSADCFWVWLWLLLAFYDDRLVLRITVCVIGLVREGAVWLPVLMLWYHNPKVMGGMLANWPVEELACGFAVVPFLALVCHTPVMRSFRLRGSWCLHYVSARLAHQLASLDGWREGALLGAIAVGIPQAGEYLAHGFAYACLAEVVLMSLANACTPTWVRSVVTRVLSFAAGTHRSCFRVAAWCCGLLCEWTGVCMYDHLGHFAPEVSAAMQDAGVWCDPLWYTVDDVALVEDNARTHACGDVLSGRPVVARCGSVLLTGIPSGGLPYGYDLCAPIITRKGGGRGMLKILSVSMTGQDDQVHTGDQICELRTITGLSCGFGYEGVLVASHHGTKARPIASRQGAKPALSSTPSRDTVIYPLPAGMGCLTRCLCSAREGYLPLAHGKCLKLYQDSEDCHKWTLDLSVSLSELKGRSGTPLLCKNGDVIGMFTHAGHKMKAVDYIRVVDVVTVSVTKEPAVVTAPPPVLAKYSVRNYVAPTGSGKSTKMPMKYVQEGKKVLVINPSVATTSAMPGYMRTAHSINPSVTYGETETITGSGLHYVTYGRFCATPDRFLTWADVVICDECHATDETTVLGIGTVLSYAEINEVKLVVLATATPPGVSVFAHENVTEVALGTEGPVPFYGKTLDPAVFREGRHIVFCDTISKVGQVAGSLEAAGVSDVVQYWRGKDIATIPTTGHAVVVCTDALMTGYTGDFDTVTDCCVSVYQHAVVNYEPTFEVAVRSGASTAVTRMQRRGRCGRGRTGVYYYAASAVATHGTVDLSSVIGAYDLGLAWHRLSSIEVEARLRAYMNALGLPSITADVSSWTKVFTPLEAHIASQEVARAKQRGHSFPFLTGVSIVMAKLGNFSLPPGERWTGYGPPQEEGGFSICTFDGSPPTKHLQNPALVALGTALGLAECSLTTLIGVGGVVMGLLMMADAMGCLVTGSTYFVGAVSQVPLQSVEGEVEEMSWDFITMTYQQALEVSSSVWDKVMVGWRAAMASHPTGLEGFWARICEYAQGHGGALMTAAQLGGGFSLLGCAPVVGTTMIGVGFGLLALPPLLKFQLAVLGAGVAAKIAGGNTGVSVGVVAAGVTMLETTGLFSPLFSILTGYAAGTSAAAVTFKLVRGEIPTMSELVGLISGVFNPGAAVIGVVAAFLLGKFCKDASPMWMNRLLAMTAKCNILPSGYFVEAGDNSAKMQALLCSLTPSALLAAFTAWCQSTDEIVCDSSAVSAWCESIWAWIVKTIRYIWTKLTTLTKYKVKMPFVSCVNAFDGKWKGSGTVVSTCGCGAKLSYYIDDGKVSRASCSSAGCAGWWNRGVVLGPDSVIEGECAPIRPARDHYEVFPCGFRGFYRVMFSRGSKVIVGVTDAAQTIPKEIPGIEQAVWCDSSPMCHVEASSMPVWLGYGAAVTINKQVVALPLRWQAPVAAEVTRSEPELKAADSMLKTITAMSRAMNAMTSHLPSQCCTVCTDPEIHTQIAMMDALEANGIWMKEEPEMPPEEVEARRRRRQRKKKKAQLVHASAETPSSESCSDDSVVEEVNRCVSTLNNWKEFIPLRSEMPEEDKLSIAAGGLDVDAPTSFEMDELKSFGRTGCSREETTAILDAWTGKPPRSGSSEASGPSDGCSRERTTAVLDAWFGGDKKKSPPPVSFGAGESLPDDIANEIALIDMLTSGDTLVVDLPPEKSKDADETPCGLSYVWNGVPLVSRIAAKKMAPVANFTRGLGSLRCNVYATRPEEMSARVAKVTIERASDDWVHPNVAATVESCIGKLKKGSVTELSLEEACALTPSKSARSFTGLTAAEVRACTPGARKGILAAYSSLSSRCQKYKFVTVMPKVEWFAKTKPTLKPPRLIMYPPLEMRVAEKMVLGKAGPHVVKTLLGEAYGFQYTPNERAQKLVEFWGRYERPMGFSADALCFDSQITPADMRLEARLYAHVLPAASGQRVATLTEELYAKSQMQTMDGDIVGERRCRASGTYTTSCGNTLVCWLKMTTALRMLDVSDYSLLICGDDCVVVKECGKDATADVVFLRRLEETLASLGLVQGERLTPCYDLCRITSCSSHVSYATSRLTNRITYFLGRDCMTPLARAMVETPGENPLCRFLGAIVQYYPTVWASRVLVTAWCEILMTLEEIDPESELSCEYMGNTLLFQLKQLPVVLWKLHGPTVFSLTTPCIAELSETAAALSFLGYPPLRAWKLRAKAVKRRMLSGTAATRFLAESLLWHTGSRPYTRIDRRQLDAISLRGLACEPWGGFETSLAVRKTVSVHDVLFAVAALIAAVAVVITFV